MTRLAWASLAGTGLAMAALAWPSAAQARCQAPWGEAGVGRELSQWDEHDAQGRRLLRERGWLTATELSLGARCLGLDWQAGWGVASGGRDYSGQSVNGAPLFTTSQVRQHSLKLQALMPLPSGWSLGVRTRYQAIDRHIQDAGPILGYPERFELWQAALGGRFEPALAGPWCLAIQGWVGAGPGGRVQLKLPNADAARLPLGPSLGAELAARVIWSASAPSGPGWHAQLGLTGSVERIQAGAARALTRNGLVVGGAAQPRVEPSTWQIQAGLVWRH